MFNKKILSKVVAIGITLAFSLINTNLSYAGDWSQHAVSMLYDTSKLGARGVKGDFKLPSIDSNYSSTYNSNFITFEQWITVNGTSEDWLEIGYMDGAIDPENDGSEDYKGFFKAKCIGEDYWEAKLNKTATVGTTYTFTIVDVNNANLWEIYIGSTYFGSFSGNITNSYDLRGDQGYEFNIAPGSGTPTRNTTNVSNQQYRYNSIWNNWSNLSTKVSENDNTPYISTVDYDSTYNKTTFTK